jgi:predicted enzyme related to lactoylglutathione lyase
MERVTGIGGFFFRSSDPEALARWYETNLGIDPTPQTYGGTVWTQEAGATVFAPFPESFDGPPLGPSGWGINFRVTRLDAIVEQLRTSGVDVSVDGEVYPNGRFAQLSDPEGNAVQLWEPS